MMDILNVFNLSQSVNQSTHKKGHILDWVIFRESDNVLLNSTISQDLSSDHFTVVSHLDVEIPKPCPMFRNIYQKSEIN